MKDASTKITVKAGCINCSALTNASLFVVNLKWFALAGVCVLSIFRLKRNILFVQT